MVDLATFATMRGSMGCTGPSGSPSTTSKSATATGRSIRRQAVTRWSTMARKNDWL
jgi:hypothetical protein